MDRDFSRAVVGLITLKHLAASDLCTAEDYQMLDKIGGAKIDALTLFEESEAPVHRRSDAQQPGHPLGRGFQATVPPGPARCSSAVTSSLFDLESRGERVFAASAGMAKALTEADRLVSFVATRHPGRDGGGSAVGRPVRQQVSWRHG